MSLTPGLRLGPYEIVGLLGVGGMGEVYRATDTHLKRAVAIKVLPSEVGNDPERLARLQREAEVLATLNHPNIAHVYGLERSGGTSALVMELVDGVSLADRIARGALPVEEALAIAKQIAAALEAAHEKTIIHRDLKPPNIKITPQGVVKVLDFGLAKATAPGNPGSTPPSAPADSPTVTPAMATRVGVLLGTPAYMAPEQARGDVADRRTDVWAFGCVLYEMLTGGRAFPGDQVTDTLAGVLLRDPDWGAVAHAPAAVNRLLRRCLQKDRTRRLADVSDAKLDIEDALARTSDADTAPAPAGKIWRGLPWGLAVVLAALVGIAIVASRRSHTELPAVKFGISLLEGQTFTNANDQSLAVSPDGQRVVFVANRQLYVRSMSDPVPHALSGTDVRVPVRAPTFSPDGRWIVFGSGEGGGTLKRVSVDGGEPITLCPMPYPMSGISWGPLGIVFAEPDAIWRVSPNGGQPERLIQASAGERLYGPVVLPDGKHLLFSVLKNGAPTARLLDASAWDAADIIVQTVPTGERRRLVAGGSDARYVSSGHLLYARQGVVFAAPFDVASAAVTGEAVPVLEGVAHGLSPLQATTQLSVSPTGTLAYLAGPPRRGKNTLAWLDRGGAVQPLNIPAAAYSHPRVAPNGAYAAVQGDDGSGPNVWLIDLRGERAARKLTFGGNDRAPIWSPDSARIAFQSNRDGDSAIFLQRADGTGSAERLTKPEQGTVHIPNSWSPDGAQLLYTVAAAQRASLWSYSFASHTPTRFDTVESGELPNAAFSPDGRWVAYVQGDHGQRNVFVQPVPPGGAPYQVSRTESTGANPFWSPDGHELFFGRGPNDYVAVRVSTRPVFSVSDPIIIPSGGRFAIGTQREYDIAPDGKRFLVVVPEGQQDWGRSQIQVVLNWFADLKAKTMVR